MFPKGLVHDFGQKMLIYISCICWKKCLEKISGDVLDRKQAIPGYKNINFILLPIRCFLRDRVQFTAFVQNFISCFCAKKMLRKYFLDVLDENITSVSKTMKISILPSHQIGCFLRGQSMILIKNVKNFHFLFLSENKLRRDVW